VRHLRALVALIALALVGCGTVATPAPTTSALEARQTEVALENRPTLPPVPTLPPSPTPAMPAVLKVVDDDPRAMGSPTAPVTIYEFTDFECPYCQQFFNETRSQLIAQYVDRGVVRIVARDYPLIEIHPSAMIAAIAGRCAANQQLFWPMYEKLFSTHQVEWGGVPKRDRAVLVDLAVGVGADKTTFSSCLDDPATEQAVRAEAQAAGHLGVNSTPNFLVNGQLVRGSLSFSSFSRLIDALVQ
jgi:protein-disulfide isomerase